MASQDQTSKFEQMRSRRHMLNELGPKPAASNSDQGLIAASKPPIKKSVSRQAVKATADLTPIQKKPTTFSKNAGKVIGLEIDKFKDWVGLNEDGSGDADANRKFSTPLAGYK